MKLQDEIMSDPRATEMPLAFLKHIEHFSPETWNALIAALKRRDKDAAAKLLGITPEQAEQQFKQIQERAAEIFQKYPTFVDLKKGR